MLGLILLSLLASHSQAALSDSSSFAVSIVTQSMPASVGTPQLFIDSEPRSVLPAFIEVSIGPGQKRKVDIWGEEFQHYSFQLTRSATGVQLEQYVDSCTKERATPAVTTTKTAVKIVLTFRIDQMKCSSNPSTALPDSRIKIRFQSQPQDAILYFKNSSFFVQYSYPIFAVCLI